MISFWTSRFLDAAGRIVERAAVMISLYFLCCAHLMMAEGYGWEADEDE